MKKVSYALAILIAMCALSSAQTGITGAAGAAEEVRGVEFAAALNLPLKDVKVAGTFFLPQKVRRVRAVIVSLAWGLGETFYRDPQVGRLLETTESAVLIVRVSNIQTTRTANQQRSASPQSADALLMLLKKLAQESGHQELVGAPLLFWGHSAAGNFGADFVALHPERTIALVLYQSGAGGRDWKVLTKIPALICENKLEDPAIAGNAETFWKHGRAIGEPWTFALQRDAPHGSEEYLKKADDLVIPWITAVLRQRLSPDGKTLRAVTDGSAWMGNNQTGVVGPYDSFSGLKPDASWLPDEATARGWQFVTGLSAAK